MKALEKDRTRRYESASAMAEDLNRYLHDEPVLACPPTPGYRIQKFLRRNRGLVAAATLVLSTLVVGVAASTWQAIRAYEAESLAEHQLKVAQNARREADAERSRAEANLRSAREAVDEYLTLVSEELLLEQPELQALRKTLLESALKYYEAFLERGNGAPQVQIELAAAYYRVGQIYAAVDSPDASLAALSQCLDLVEKLQSDPACTPDMWKTLAGVHKGARPFHDSTRPISDRGHALAVLQRAVAIWEELVERHPDVLAFQSDLASLSVALGELHADFGRRNEAIVLLRQACDLLESLVQQTSVMEHRAELSRAYGRLGLQYFSVGNRDDAASVRREAVRLAQGLVHEAPQRPYFVNLLANGYGELGNSLVHIDPAAAQEALGQSLAMHRTLVGDFPNVPVFRERMAVAWFNLANLLVDNDRADEAAPAFHEAVEIMDDVVARTPSNSDGQRRLAKYHYTEGLCLRSTGRHADASRAYGRALLIRRGLVAAFPSVARYQQELAWQLATCPDPDLRDSRAAMLSAQQAVELSPQNATCWTTLGVAQYRAGDWIAAVKSLKHARQLPTFNQSLDWFLAMAHYRAGDVAQARQYYDQARTWMDQNRPNDEELRCFRAEAAEVLKIDVPPTTRPE
ncbi:MAG: tetratricopeptide repeat protein [Planctomycetaceae bacterium]|nr:tetratricopeptide repeat protein [Planctomycetaceae bacterium]